MSKDIPYKILIIDDTQSMLMLLEYMLEQKEDFSVFTADNGTSGLQLIEEIMPDLILLDIAMPGFSGFDVSQKLAENLDTKDIPVIFLSAFTDTFQKIKAFELGGVDYITKPFNEEELIARIYTQLKIAQLRKDLQKANEKLEEKVKLRTKALESEIEIRKKTEEKYLKNKEMLEQIADHSSVFISLVNNDLDYIFVNKEYEKFFRLNKEEIIGKNIRDILSQNAYEIALPNLEKAKAGEKTEFSYVLSNKFSEEIHISVIYTPFIQNETIAGIIILAVNTSELKKTETLLLKAQCQLKEINNQLEQKIEERTKELIYKNEELQISQNLFKNFVNHSVSWEIFCNKKGRLLYCTPAFEKITGYSLEKYLQENINIKNFVVKEDIALYNEFWQKALDGQNFENYEFRIFTSHKEIKYMLMSVFQVFDEKNVHIGFRAGIIDISKQKEEEKARIAAENKVFNAIIESEENERARFAKELHDGIGPILSTIKMFVQWLKKPELKTPKDEIYKKLEFSIEEAVSTVKEISNNLSPHILANFGLIFALKSYIEKTESMNNPAINFKTNINQRFSKEIEITVYRAILECIHNTLKHGQASEIMISIQLSDNKIFGIYTDNGIGFDFDSIILENRGLGLFNIQNRISTLGGKFDLQSSPNNGVSIHFELNI